MISLFLVFFITILIRLFLNFSSFLNSLLLLESLSLIILIFIFSLIYVSFSLNIFLFYFVFIASESALGLAILVKSIKFFGTNNFCRINLVVC
jgi:hypothetical protein